MSLTPFRPAPPRPPRRQPRRRPRMRSVFRALPLPSRPEVTCAPSLHPHKLSACRSSTSTSPLSHHPTPRSLHPPHAARYRNLAITSGQSACTHRTPSTSTIEPLHSTSSSSLVFAAPWTLPSTGSFRRTRTGAGPLSLQQLDSVRCQSQW